MISKEWNKKLKSYSIAVGIATFFAIMSYLVYTTSDLAENFYYDTTGALSRIPKTFVNEITAAYSFLLLIPVMIYFFKKVPLNKENLFKKLFYYLLFSILIGLNPHCNDVYKQITSIPCFRIW